MRRVSAALIFVAASFAAAPAAELQKASPTKSSAIVAKAGNDYWAWLQKENVFVRVRLGLPIETLPDFSLKRVEADAAFGGGLLARLEKANEAELSHEDQLSL